MDVAGGGDSSCFLREALVFFFRLGLSSNMRSNRNVVAARGGAFVLSAPNSGLLREGTGMIFVLSILVCCLLLSSLTCCNTGVAQILGKQTNTLNNQAQNTKMQ
jgi:hypothetical protein